MKIVRLKPTSAMRDDQVRTQAKRNAMAHNNCLTEDFLNQKSDEELLCFVHPTDRISYASKLGLPVYNYQ